MKNKSVITLLVLFITNICSVAFLSAQPRLIDDFTDGDFASSPPWTGTTSHFIVNTGKQLQLNNSGAAASYLTAPFAPVDGSLEWSIYVRLAFSGSSNNYSRIYLLSNEAVLTQPLQGYYLQLGEAGANDAVELFRQTGTTSTSICRAPNGTIAAAFAIRIKVTRSDTGVWKLFIDYTGGTEFKEEAAGTDATHPTGSHFGFVCVYTAGNSTRFYFDDVYAGPVPDELPPPEPALPSDVVINELFADPSPAVGLPAHEFVEIYNRSTKIFNLRNWSLGDASGATTLTDATLGPDEYLILTTSAGASEYSILGRTMAISSFPSLNNTGDAIVLVGPDGHLIDSLTYSLDWYQDDVKAGGGYSLERLNPEVSALEPTNWYASVNSSGGTPGARNSVFGRNPDSRPPKILSMAVSDEGVVHIRFSEPMSPTSVSSPANYVLEGIGSVASATYRPSDSTAVVMLSGMVNGTNYRLIAQNLQDVAGNVGPAAEITFIYFVEHPVLTRDLIINEIMADPSPAVQLPEAEYVEIYNRSMHPIRLSGWTLEDATSRAQFGSTIVMPASYLLVTSTTNIAKFATTNNAIGLSSFPSLGNGGDVVMLRDKGGMLIDSVKYETSWYHNLEKAEGGWSMELIDVHHPCGEGDNWTSSEDDRGGTPGLANSVKANKPDLTGPVMKELRPLNATELSLTFDERLHPDPAQIEIMINPGSRRATVRFRDRTFRELIAWLDEPLALSAEFVVSVRGVADCSGNAMLPTEVPIALPENAAIGDVVINEILFNPRPNGVDFLEVLNTTNKYIDVNGWKISNGSPESSKVISGVPLLTPHTYLVFTPSMVATQVNYPLSYGRRLTEFPLPSFPDDEGQVVLSDQAGIVVDQFKYSEDLHSPILDDPEGVSLERIMVTGKDDGTNWQSAASTAGYATPGYENSSSRSAPGIDPGSVIVQPEVILPQQAPFAQIYYAFDDPGLVANVRIIDLDGRVVKSIASNQTIGPDGFFKWDGDRDDGSAAPGGYYLVWFQAFGLDGRVLTFRKRIVIGI